MNASCYEMGMYSDGNGGCFADDKTKLVLGILVRCGAFVGVGVAVEVLISLWAVGCGL